MIYICFMKFDFDFNHMGKNSDGRIISEMQTQMYD